MERHGEAPKVSDFFILPSSRLAGRGGISGRGRPHINIFINVSGWSTLHDTKLSREQHIGGVFSA